MITSKKNIDTPDKNYNYLKSIKDKENIIISYYRKLSHLETDKPKILPKIKKRTLKINEIDKDKIEKKTKKQIVIMDD